MDLSKLRTIKVKECHIYFLLHVLQEYASKCEIEERDEVFDLYCSIRAQLKAQQENK